MNGYEAGLKRHLSLDSQAWVLGKREAFSEVQIFQARLPAWAVHLQRDQNFPAMESVSLLEVLWESPAQYTGPGT